jgi:hypothetical protein
MAPDTMISKKSQPETISNLLVKPKVDFQLAPEASHNMKPRPIFILSQNFKPSSEMVLVPSNKPESTTELLVSVKLTSMSQ